MADSTSITAAAAAPRTGLLDLERELSCAICTDPLYQPLTLLDCLHTFCGACLKLWFTWQASQADAQDSSDDEDGNGGNDVRSRRENPYTCPSCRARVRDTKHDAKITTLLDMYLAANPGRAKSEVEKEETRGRYAPGDDVVPRLRETWRRQGGRGREDEADRRMVREVGEMSLREAAGRQGANRAGYERGVRHQARARAEGMERRGSEREQAQQLEHQSSLRSLISADDADSASMEEEILRQIVEEGLLDGIDLQDLTSEQEDELMQRIAEAYRQRHGRGQQERARHRPQPHVGGQVSEFPNHAIQGVQEARRSAGHSPSSSSSRRRASSHVRSASDVQRSPRHSNHVPVPREDLLQAYPANSRSRTRSSDGRSQTTTVSAAQGQAPAARSVTDLSSNSSRSLDRPRRSSYGTSTSDTSSNRQPRPGGNPLIQPPMQSPPLSPSATTATTGNRSRGHAPRTNSLTTASTAPSVLPLEHMVNQEPTLVAYANYHANMHVTAPSSHSRCSPVSNGSHGVGRLKGYPEPNISCDGCGKSDIQYKLHHNCPSCKDGKFNLCDHCYKSGRGCLNWYGFGDSAWQRYQQKGAPSSELPHVLFGVQYHRPNYDESVPGNLESRSFAKEPPLKRRNVGAFCYTCQSYADDLFYKCDECNDGEWGYCGACVNLGRCCTHPLLPLAHEHSPRKKTSPADAAKGMQVSFALSTESAMIQPFPPSKTVTTRKYRPLTIYTICDVCRHPIQPVQSRFHCPAPNCHLASQDPSCISEPPGSTVMDICTTCYSRLQDSGTIKRSDGENGWRRCPRGHRMLVYCFLGQRRIVTQDIVGGHFLKDDEREQQNNDGPSVDERRYAWNEGERGQKSRIVSRATAHSPGQPTSGVGRGEDAGMGNARFPPAGGVGKRCLARWSWIPEEGVADELMFPKGAVITEVLDVTDEWCEGAFAGAKGVFPASYVTMIDVVTMS